MSARGGDGEKIEAAAMATRSGTCVVIAAGTEPDVLPRLAKGEAIGTRFLPEVTRVESRKRLDSGRAAARHDNSRRRRGQGASATG